MCLWWVFKKSSANTSDILDPIIYSHYCDICPFGLLINLIWGYASSHYYRNHHVPYGVYSLRMLPVAFYYLFNYTADVVAIQVMETIESTKIIYFNW